MARTSIIPALRPALVQGSVWAIAAAACAQEPLAANGPLSSMPAAHESGADLVWAVPNGAAVGVSAYQTLGYRLAESFELDAPATIESIVVYAYQQGAIDGPSIDFLAIEIWNGQPGRPGSTRVAGDIARNALSQADPTNAFAALHGVDFTTDRPIYALTADDLDWSLDAGEYWLVWTMGGSLDGGPYSPYLGDDAQPVPGQAMQRVLGAWRPARNQTEGGVQVALPFEVYGSTACPADCDGDGTLTIFDFLCFQNAFAEGDMQADCNGDGAITADDFACFQNAFMAGCD